MKIFLSEGGQLINKIDKILIKNSFSNIDDLAEFASDKNNSKYKIKRVILNVILMIEEDDVFDPIIYFHMLGFNKKGSSYVTKLNNLNIITSLKNEDCVNAEIEKRISNLFNLLSNQVSKQDFLPPTIN